MNLIALVIPGDTLFLEKSLGIKIAIIDKMEVVFLALYSFI
jgi:hypothetical protein